MISKSHYVVALSTKCTNAVGLNREMSKEMKLTFEIVLPVLLVPRLPTPMGLDLAAAW
jgi:hypothetical protein